MEIENLLRHKGNLGKLNIEKDYIDYKNCIYVFSFT